MICFIKCRNSGCERKRKDFHAKDKESFIADAHAEGWTDDGIDKWICPDCQPDTESEHIESIMPNFSAGDAVIILPRGMTAQDWDDLEERVRSLRATHGVK